MNFTSAWLTLKHHRFEVAAAALAALLFGMAALWVNSRLGAVSMPAGCFEAWFSSAGEPGVECSVPMHEFLTIDNEEAGKVFAAMAFLPFAVGLIAGVPVVARELESRTAATAWALAGSRRRWLVKQLWPILLVLGGCLVFAALASALLQSSRSEMSYPLQNLGLYGPLVATRAFAMFGVGLLAGAIVGRTLPAFIVGVVLSALLLFALTGVGRNEWLRAQPYEVLDMESLGGHVPSAFVIVDGAWRDPEGNLMSDQQVLGLAPAGVDPYEWAYSHFEQVSLGISGEVAQQWEAIETVGFTLAGLLLIGATVPIVERRRPS